MTDYNIKSPIKSILFEKYVQTYFSEFLNGLEQQILMILKKNKYGLMRSEICEILELPKYHIKWYQSGYGFRESDFHRSRTTIFNHLTKLQQIGFISKKRIYSGEVGGQPTYWYLKTEFFSILPNI